jgi:hypothetical protein
MTTDQREISIQLFSWLDHTTAFHGWQYSLGAATVTGSKAVDAVAESNNSPRSKARRHLNTWFAFSP